MADPDENAPTRAATGKGEVYIALQAPSPSQEKKPKTTLKN